MVKKQATLSIAVELQMQMEEANKRIAEIQNNIKRGDDVNE